MASDWPVFCMHCGKAIEACAGRWSDWMHIATRRERCEDGSLAAPETAGRISAFFSGKKSRKA